eukprot:Gb_15948 [translate_table: standard]
MTGQEAKTLVEAFNLEIGIVGSILTKLAGWRLSLSVKEEEAETLRKKIMVSEFDFDDFLKQTRMNRVIGMIPGMGKAMDTEDAMVPEKGGAIYAAPRRQNSFLFLNFVKRVLGRTSSGVTSNGCALLLTPHLIYNGHLMDGGLSSKRAP